MCAQNSQSSSDFDSVEITHQYKEYSWAALLLSGPMTISTNIGKYYVICIITKHFRV